MACAPPARRVGSFEFSETFDYDNLGRLTDHKRGLWNGTSISTIRLHECWTYDRSGNARVYSTGNSPSCGSTVTQEFNASNEIKSRNGDMNYAIWNDLGSLIRKGFATDSYAWDVWNRMTQAANYGTGSTLANYTYNALGQVIARTNSFSLQPDIYYYYGASGEVLEEIKFSGGAVHNWYVWGSQGDGDLVVRGPSIRYSILDARGNVATHVDATVAPLARYVYEGYGKPLQLTANWSTWQAIAEDLHLALGELYHKDHAQYHMGNRMADPDLWGFTDRSHASNNGYSSGHVYIEPASSPTTVRVCCNYSDGTQIPVESNRPEVTCAKKAPKETKFTGLSAQPCKSSGGSGTEGGVGPSGGGRSGGGSVPLTNDPGCCEVFLIEDALNDEDEWEDGPGGQSADHGHDDFYREKLRTSRAKLQVGRFSSPESLDLQIGCINPKQKVRKLTIVAHGNQTGFNAGNGFDGKDPELEVTCDTMPAWINAFNRRKFCHPCEIEIESCGVGAGCIPQHIANVSGCTVKADCGLHSARSAKWSVPKTFEPGTRFPGIHGSP